jgi:hypothetical protein
MNPFEMVVMIVFIVVVGKVALGRRASSQVRGLSGRMDAAPDAEMHKLRSEFELLSRRVQTLEKLATDPAARLADDIERLRDARN